MQDVLSQALCCSRFSLVVHLFGIYCVWQAVQHKVQSRYASFCARIRALEPCICCAHNCTLGVRMVCRAFVSLVPEFVWFIFRDSIAAGAMLCLTYRSTELQAGLLVA